MTIRPTKRVQKWWTGTSPFTVVAWILIIVGLLAMQRLGTEMQRMKRIMENYSAVVGTGWNDAPDPITITTTVYASSTKQWFADIPTSSPFEPATSSTATTIRVSQPTDIAVSPVIIPTQDGSRDVPEPMASSSERYALSLPIQHILNFTWPVHDFHMAVDTVLKTVDKVWQMFRKVYHYPLDPP